MTQVWEEENPFCAYHQKIPNVKKYTRPIFLKHSFQNNTRILWKTWTFKFIHTTITISNLISLLFFFFLIYHVTLHLIMLIFIVSHRATSESGSRGARFGNTVCERRQPTGHQQHSRVLVAAQVRSCYLLYIHIHIMVCVCGCHWLMLECIYSLWTMLISETRLSFSCAGPCVCDHVFSCLFMCMHMFLYYF